MSYAAFLSAEKLRMELTHVEYCIRIRNEDLAQLNARKDAIESQLKITQLKGER